MKPSKGQKTCPSKWVNYYSKIWYRVKDFSSEECSKWFSSHCSRHLKSLEICRCLVRIVNPTLPKETVFLKQCLIIYVLMPSLSPSSPVKISRAPLTMDSQSTGRRQLPGTFGLAENDCIWTRLGRTRSALENWTFYLFYPSNASATGRVLKCPLRLCVEWKWSCSFSRLEHRIEHNSCLPASDCIRFQRNFSETTWKETTSNSVQWKTFYSPIFRTKLSAVYE